MICSQTTCIKKINFIIKQEKKMVIYTSSQTIEAPYSDTFFCEEYLIVVGSNKDDQKCIFINMMNVNFTKFTIFKS